MGALSLDKDLHQAAEFVVGNLDEDGYLAAEDMELASAFTGTSQDAAATNGHAAEQAAALDLIHRAIDLVHHLDPAGVGAHDLRQCLSIQIAAQLQEFDHLYAKPLQEPNGVDDPHRSLSADANAKIEERRRVMEIEGTPLFLSVGLDDSGGARRKGDVE